MTVLLDTHVWLWMLTDDKRIGADTRAVIEEADSAFVSIASLWELAIKSSHGRITLSATTDWFDTALQRSACTALAIDIAHVATAAALPRHHKDPFDRMLVAQATVLDVPIITVDDKIQAYDVATLAP